ncbi:LOW QUALITY PROTEIN: hypothetical protein TorRG33x02_220550 [Trema orientale]|uniref:Uncharacterized protein n=1 Tax=Trema orientale TaxID=63057 RepID=A0A2P5E9D3_TREOI|nr:LOW QUALITY PROTEIN: hypothetical protein TorRG33x02_220550 [Trema orientale]
MASGLYSGKQEILTKLQGILRHPGICRGGSLAFERGLLGHEVRFWGIHSFRGLALALLVLREVGSPFALHREPSSLILWQFWEYPQHYQ